MAEFCKQCAEEYDFPENDAKRPKDDMLVGFLCEGCGFCVVDSDGLCWGGCDSACPKGHWNPGFLE